MKKLWTVFKREYLERVRTRWFVIATVFGPVFFGALLFLPAFMSSREQPSEDLGRIRILDATGTSLGRNVAAELGGGPLGDTLMTQVMPVAAADIAAAESTATQAVIRREIKGYLVLGAGVLEAGRARYAGMNATSIADVRRMESVVSRETLGEKLRKAGVADADAERMKRHRFVLQAERLTPTGRGGSGRVNLLFAVVVGMLLYMTILLYGQNVLRGVIEEKQSRVAEVVVSSVRPATLLAGKVLGVGAVGLTQMVVWMTASFLMIRYRVPMMRQFGLEAAPIQLPSISVGMLVLLLAFFLLGYTLYSAFFAMVGAMVSSDQEAQQAQMPVVLMLVFSITFLQPVLANPDGQLARTLSLVPVSSPIMMPLRLSSASVPPWEVALSLAILVVACFLAIQVAAWVYRVGLLLYGKRITVRELVRLSRSHRAQHSGA